MPFAGQGRRDPEQTPPEISESGLRVVSDGYGAASGMTRAWYYGLPFPVPPRTQTSDCDLGFWVGGSHASSFTRRIIRVIPVMRLCADSDNFQFLFLRHTEHEGHVLCDRRYIWGENLLKV